MADKAVGVRKNIVPTVVINIIEVVASIAEQPDLREQDVAVGDGIRAALFESRRKWCPQKAAEDEAAKEVSAGRVEFALAGLEFIVFDLFT